MTRFPIAALVLLLLGCTDENPNFVAPDGLVAGTWRFSYRNMNGLAGAPVSCTPVAFDFAIVQGFHRGISTFSGTQVGTSTITCSAQGQTVLERTFSAETIISGEISGTTIVFRLGSVPGSHTGTVGPTSINGTAQWVLTSGNVTLILNGQYTAARL